MWPTWVFLVGRVTVPVLVPHRTRSSAAFTSRANFSSTEDQHVATRFDAGLAVLLYHLPAGFFVELWYEPLLSEVVEVRSFTTGQPLEPWAELVTLPEWKSQA